jgi:glucose/arabinose dehydrogenase
MNKRLRWIIIAWALALAACSSNQSQPDSAQPLPVATIVAASSPTAAPTAADTATARPTAADTATARPTAADTATARPTAADTATARPTALPTATPTAVPAPPAVAELSIALEPLAAELSQPVFAVHAGDGSGRIFVLERAGRIVTLAVDGSQLGTFLDIRDRVGSNASEQGLLGLAFDPAFAANGRLFVHYTDKEGDTVLARFMANAERSAADPFSQVTLLATRQPADNHNGGMIAFGPDGYLYFGLGDGGGANDRYENGQNLGTILGAVLRLDVSGDSAVVPANNPFVSQEDARPEIWAYGLRNPWRFSFDRLTGDLWIADVGQGDWEEINVQPASSLGGENYGWPIMEGTRCFQSDSCRQKDLTLPVAEYSHDLGCSVTGGYVYRGAAQPALQGVYFYGDYCTGRIWGLAPAAGNAWQTAELLHSAAQISSFGETETGELLVVDYAGTLFRLVSRGD